MSPDFPFGAKSSRFDGIAELIYIHILVQATLSGFALIIIILLSTISKAGKMKFNKNAQ